MKRYMIPVILMLSGTAVFAQAKTIRYFYDKGNRMTGYAYEGLFQRSFAYDQSGNVVVRINELPYTGEEVHGENNDFKAFPNPFGETGFQVSVDADAKNIIISLYDLTGKLIPVQYTNNNGQIHVAAGQLAAGIYLCRISFNGYTGNIKVLKR